MAHSTFGYLEDASQPEKQVPLSEFILGLTVPQRVGPRVGQNRRATGAEEAQGSSFRISDWDWTEHWAGVRASTDNPEDGVNLTGRWPSGQCPRTPSRGLKCGQSTQESIVKTSRSGPSRFHH